MRRVVVSANILYQISLKTLIVFFCFHEMISRTILPVGLLKYVALFLMIFFVVCRPGFSFVRYIKEVPFKDFLAISAVQFFFSIPAFLSYRMDGSYVMRMYLFYPLFFLVIQQARYFGLKYEHLIAFFIKVMLVYAYLNVFLYFVRIPIWNEQLTLFWGRITVGYPTIDVINYLVALIFVLFFDGFSHYGFVKRLICSLSFSLGIILQTSGTGITLLLVCFVTLAIFAFLPYNSHNSFCSMQKIIFLSTLALLFVGAGVAYKFLNETNPQLLETMSYQIENRYFVLTNQENKSTINVNTMDMRDVAFEKARTTYMKKPLDYILGVGYDDVTYESKNASRGLGVFLESQVYLALFTTGIVGLLMIVRTFVMFFYKCVTMERPLTEKICFFLVLVCYVASMFSSCLFMSMAMTGPFALFLVFFIKETKESATSVATLQ